MATFHNYICLVDYYRRPSRCRNTKGRYRVGAKSEQEAKELLREKIGFGSILVYYTCDEKADRKAKKFIGYREIVQEKYVVENGQPMCHYVTAHHANDPVASYEKQKPLAVFKI